MKSILALVFLFGVSQSTTLLAPQAFQTKIKNTPGAIVLDVRTEQEVKSGAIAGARNIVYDASFGDKLGSLSKSAPLFVYCAGGVRSNKAEKILREKGFKEVYQLQGCLEAWKEAHLPLK